MADLRGDRVGFVDFAITTFHQKSGVWICVAAQGSCGQYPRLHQDLGIFHGDVVKDHVALAGEALYYVHLFGVEKSN
jgi:hypothetical protein